MSTADEPAWNATYEDARRLVNGWSNICLPIQWEPSSRAGLGKSWDAFPDLHAAHYFTGKQSEGWVLYSRLGGATWQQLTKPVKSPLGGIGDRVWVREPYSTDALTVYPCPKQWYQADFDTFWLRDIAAGEHICSKPPMANGRRSADCFGCWSYDHGKVRWRPAQTMTRERSRFRLQVVHVDVGRLHHKISGMSPEDWNRRHPEPWSIHEKNPWVFAYTVDVRRWW
jgi:hypothetical protein